MKNSQTKKHKTVIFCINSFPISVPARTTVTYYNTIKNMFFSSVGVICLKKFLFN